jgi:hypothetical protein
MIDGKKRSIHFGSNVSKTFVEGASIQKRDNYLKRHSVNEIWNEINPGSLSAGILWGDSNHIQENLKDYMKEFNIKENIIQGGAIPKNKRLYKKGK